MSRNSADNVTASAPAEQSLQNHPTNEPIDNGRNDGGRAPSPTYAQVAARPPSPHMRGGTASENTDNAPAPPPPTPLTVRSPVEAPFTQRTTAPSEDDDLGWTTVTAPAKSKKSKSKKGKGKAKVVAPTPPPQVDPASGLVTPNASPKGGEPRKRRRTDYGDEGLTADKQQGAPANLSLSSKSPLIFGHSSPSPLPSAKATKSTNGRESANEGSDMDVDPVNEAHLDNFGRSSFSLRNTSVDWESPQNSYHGHLEYNEPGPSTRPSKGHKRSAARHDFDSIIGSPSISQRPPAEAASPRTPMQQRGNRTRTSTPAAPPRALGKFLRKSDATRSPTPSSSRHAQRVSSDEDMLPASDVSEQSNSTELEAPIRKPPVHRGRGRYSVTAIGNPPVQRTPSPELTPYDLILADPDITVPPEGLLKKTQGDRVDWKKKGLSTNQVKAWNDLGKDTPFIVVQFGEHGAEQAGMNERAVFLYALLTRLSERTDIRVNPGHGPLEEREYDDNKDAPPNVEPFWIGIENLPEDWCLALARAAWLRAGNYILNFVLWRNDLPTLCAAFRSVFRFRALSREEYVAIVRRELLSSELREITLDILARDIGKGGKWRRAMQDDAFGTILDSVDVEVHNCRITQHTSEDVAFIHITSPTADWQDWLIFRNTIQAHGFGSLAAGHPIPFKNRTFCGFCHLLGHPIGRCPVRGFFFPQKTQPQKQSAVQPSSSGRGGHQGGRGRGNGRGNGRGRGGRGANPMSPAVPK
ncbi:uncharacterized protein C8Q71DRAFT_856189 [Rhodofomes roseus]|uniref:Uncharacterized protein n=1 Tax=Rhodofomes roseus TaxID=34475 RepID=A0ABQ8KJC9_9APHY|nr:uncharacterized protein C8Q71DRAFT_856189 [Rhodofomes roseus]KAH9838224.1 hypothetical protein C8Q71DRAFT_856189 [Rhodofomes roseus]